MELEQKFEAPRTHIRYTPNKGRGYLGIMSTMSGRLSTNSGKRLSTTSEKEQKTVNRNQEKTGKDNKALQRCTVAVKNTLIQKGKN